MGVKLTTMLWSGGILIMLFLGVASYSQQQTEAKFQTELSGKQQQLTEQINLTVKEREKLTRSLPKEQHSEVIAVYQYLQQQSVEAQLELLELKMADETESTSNFLLSLRGDFARLQKFLRRVESKSSLAIQNLTIEADARGAETLVLQIRIAFLR